LEVQLLAANFTKEQQMKLFRNYPSGNSKYYVKSAHPRPKLVLASLASKNAKELATQIVLSLNFYFYFQFERHKYEQLQNRYELAKDFR